jgi:hypothetical protein
LRWAADGGRDAVFERSVLVDEESGATVLPAPGGSYTTTLVGPAHRFSWRVNSLPQVEAGGDGSTGLGLRYHLSARFTDEDIASTHTATIDWGDGVSEPGLVSGFTVSGDHVYRDVGFFDVTVCVEDDLGGVGGDSLRVHVHPVLFADDFESGDTTAWGGR